MTPGHFVHKYQSEIRICLNWGIFRISTIKILEIAVHVKSELGSMCVLPWYLDGKSQEVSYDVDEARPILLSDLPHKITNLNKRRQAEIQKYVVNLNDNISVPAYNLANGKHLILDGNLRLSALMLSPNLSSFSVTIHSICCDLNERYLPDLRHWK